MTMVLPDVNVVVASLRSDHSHHELARGEIEEILSRFDSIVVPVDVLAAAMRILTLNVWNDPETSETAVKLLRDWVDATDARVIGHPTHAWTVLSEFGRTLKLTTQQVPDALLAASAIVLGVTLVTFDRGFNRYPGLTVRFPSA